MQQICSENALVILNSEKKANQNDNHLNSSHQFSDLSVTEELEMNADKPKQIVKLSEVFEKMNKNSLQIFKQGMEYLLKLKGRA